MMAKCEQSWNIGTFQRTCKTFLDLSSLQTVAHDHPRSIDGAAAIKLLCPSKCNSDNAAPSSVHSIKY